MFTHNRERLREHWITQKFFDQVVTQAIQAGLTTDEHFTVDGSLIQSHASPTSLKKIERSVGRGTRGEVFGPSAASSPRSRALPSGVCGRFTYLYRWRELVELMRLLGVPTPELTPRYNVAPTQRAPVVRAVEDGREGVMLRWGLVPPWAEDVAVGSRSINARSETVATKPTFREAFKARRCLVPVSGFYEWRVMGDGTKQPYYITRLDRSPFALAGLWEPPTRVQPETGTFTILTTSPNALMRPLHDRMPVIVASADYDLWLRRESIADADVERIVQPIADSGFEAYPVSRRVNSPRNDGPDLVARVAEPESGTMF